MQTGMRGRHGYQGPHARLGRNDVARQVWKMKQYTAAAKKFYSSGTWKRTRELYAESVEGLCERCRSTGLYRPGKIVHHKIYLDDAKLQDPKIALSFENLELLCQECHNKEHMRKIPKRRYSFDAAGNIINQE